jgi:putative tryptophan/tyrosine transport system substrate-binding protein
MSLLSRRRLIQAAGAMGLGLVAAGSSRAQEISQAARVRRIGYLGPGFIGLDPRVAALYEGLRELQYGVGQDLIIGERHSQGQLARYPELAGELVELPIELIVAAGDLALSAALLATRAATFTSRIPIVAAEVEHSAVLRVRSTAFLVSGWQGLTTVPMRQPDRFERLQWALRDTLPALTHVILLWSAAYPEAALRWMPSSMNYFQPVEVRELRDVERALTTAQAGTDAVLVLGHELLTDLAVPIARLAGQQRLPCIGEAREIVEAGGLMTSGPSLPALYRRAAEAVDRFLTNTRTASMAMEEAVEQEFVINLRTAQALGLTIPRHVLLQGDGDHPMRVPSPHHICGA